jgi:hypothetical protein
MLCYQVLRPSHRGLALPVRSQAEVDAQGSVEFADEQRSQLS